MLQGFEFIRAKNLKEAGKLLAEPGSRALAGGTDILVRLRHGMTGVNRLVDISALKELHGIRETKSHVVYGALASWTEVLQSPAAQAHHPALTEAALEMGSPQVRNLASFGGNVVNASPAGDALPGLYLYGAYLELLLAGKKRKVPVEAFITGPGRTVLQPGEILTAIHVPLRFTDSGFLRLGTRKALAISKVSAAAGITLDGDRIVDLAVTLGAVGPVVYSVPHLDEYRGQKFTRSVVADVVDRAAVTATPIDDIRSTREYRSSTVPVLVKRLLEQWL